MSYNNTNTDILLAGAIAAFTVDLLVYPLDTIKTRIQSPDYKRIYVDASTQTVKKRILFRGLYQGVGSVIIATLPSSGAFFTTYEATKSFLQNWVSPDPEGGGQGHDQDGRRRGRRKADNMILPQPLINATASSIGELVSCLILTPAEVLKQNAQMITRKAPGLTTRSHNNTLLSRLRTSPSILALHQFQHPTQLWRGYSALVARNLPFTAIQFPLFEHLKTTLLPPSPDQQPIKTASLTAISGGVAGSVASIITTPVDVIKTRIMLAAATTTTTATTADNQNLASSSSSSSSSNKSTSRTTAWTTGKNILRDEGIKTLFRGGLLRAVWTALGSGLYLGAYETGRRYFEGRRRRKRRKVD